MDFFNVHTSDFAAIKSKVFGEAEVSGRILHTSADRRHMTVASKYPDGVRFRYGGDIEHLETFYVVAGQGNRTFPDGRTIEMREGDVIFVAPGVDVEYYYGPGFIDVAFFWSAEPLPAWLTEGLSDNGTAL